MNVRYPSKSLAIELAASDWAVHNRETGLFEKRRFWETC
jgi:hypothetical protein